MQLRRLDRDQCLAFLEDHRLGRLACISAGQPYVVPVHYAFTADHLYMFSMAGRKIDALRANPAATMLVEQIDNQQAWRSVLVEGTFEELPDRLGYKRQRDMAWQLLSRHASWWEPAANKPAGQPIAANPEYLFFRLSLDVVSGREALLDGN